MIKAQKVQLTNSTETSPFRKCDPAALYPDPLLQPDSLTWDLIVSLSIVAERAVFLAGVPEPPYLRFNLKAATIKASPGLEAYGCGTVTVSDANKLAWWRSAVRVANYDLTTQNTVCEITEQDSVFSPQQDSSFAVTAATALQSLPFISKCFEREGQTKHWVFKNLYLLLFLSFVLLGEAISMHCCFPIGSLKAVFTALRCECASVWHPHQSSN